jgi:hypothetical protein
MANNINTNGKQSYASWEEAVANSLSDKLEISYSDAQGIIESNEFYMAQAWAKGMDSKQTADFIDSKTSMAKGGGIRSFEIYHKTLASALEEVEDWAVRNGYTFISEHYFPDVTSGGVKYGETKRFKREVKKDGKNKEGDIAIQVYRMDSGTYELNLYPTFKRGGSIEGENLDMVKSQNKAISHHTKELQSQLNMGKDAPAWVVSKVSRASNDLSDVTHYLDGEKMANGGSLYKDFYSGQGGMKFKTEEEVENFIKTAKPFVKKQLEEGNFVVMFNGKEFVIAEKIKDKKDAYYNMANGGGIYKMSEKDRARLDVLQNKEDYNGLSESENDEYERLVLEYRKTPEYKYYGKKEGEYAKGGKVVGYEVAYQKMVGGEYESDIKSFTNKEDADKFAKETYGYVDEVYENQYNFDKKAKGGKVKFDKTLISSLPKRRRADRKYTHFAVRKSDNKILNGWDYSEYDSEDLNSDKQHYFYYDMDDMDVPKNEYTIKKAQTLIRLGVNPFDYDNWRNLDFSNDKPYVEGKMAYGGNINEWDEEQYPSRRKMLESILSKEFGSMNQYSSSADWGGIPVWSLSGDDLEGTFIGIGDDDGLFIVEREQDYEVGDTKETEIMTASYDEIPKMKRMIAKAKTMQGKMAKGGGVGKGYKVFNYTDDIFASDKTFSNRTKANDFIKEFRKKYEGQGYYRDNRMRKIDVKDIDLLAIPSDFNPYKKMANGGGIGEDNEVVSFFKNIDYSKLPPAFAEYIKTEVLTDADLQYLSPKEPIFLEIKSKVEAYTNKGASTTATTTTAAVETGDSEEKKKVLQEISDLEGIKEFVSGDELNKINKELDDLNGLLPIL